MESQKDVNVTRIVIMLLLVLVIIPMLPILISGRWGWWEAWIMAAIFILTFIVSRALAVRKTPDILKERANYGQHKDTQPWDRWLSPLVAFGSVFIMLVAIILLLTHINAEEVKRQFRGAVWERLTGGVLVVFDERAAWKEDAE